MISYNDDRPNFKSHADLNRKDFFDQKDNIYRVKKLIKLVSRLNEPDIDIELDDLKFTKLKKYKDYSLVKFTTSELKKLLPNFEIKDDTEHHITPYLNFLGIHKLEKDAYSLQLDIFVDKLIRINLREITLEENIDVIFRMFDKDHNNLISKAELIDLMTYFGNINKLGFDHETLRVIADALFKEISKSTSGSINKQQLANYLSHYKDEDITINPFIRIKTNDVVTKIKRNKTLPVDENDERQLERISRKKDRSIIQ